MSQAVREIQSPSGMAAPTPPARRPPLAVAGCGRAIQVCPGPRSLRATEGPPPARAAPAGWPPPYPPPSQSCAPSLQTTPGQSVCLLSLTAYHLLRGRCVRHSHLQMAPWVKGTLHLLNMCSESSKFPRDRCKGTTKPSKQGSEEVGLLQIPEPPCQAVPLIWQN